ncbi:hypothetical protein BH09MYX1_BH09MYX1_41950 [soil metagenome]
MDTEIPDPRRVVLYARMMADEPSALRSLRILVVDDERAIADSLRMVLADEHDVVAVTRAEDALTRLRAGEVFDVMLCDLMMPEISGMRFFDELDPSLRSRVVFLTGGAFTAASVEFLARIPNVCIEKPFQIEVIRGVVREAAARAQ